MNEFSDLEIMRRIQSGETQLMGILYERHKLSLFNYFLRCTSDRVISEDMVHNVFLKVMKNTHNFSGTGEFRYWLFRIARNSWIDNTKKKEPVLKAVALDGVHHKSSFLDEPDTSIMEQRKAKLRNALECLSEEKRDAIILSRYQGMDYKMIAEISDCTESAVKSRVMRGLSEIRKMVNG